jgi:prephenate dehydratase
MQYGRDAGARARFATLGSSFTFAGQATEALLRHRSAPDAQCDYFPTMDAVAEAVLDGVVDAGVLTSETSRTACTDTAARILAGDPLFVVDEIVVPYRCALLGRPGTRIDQVTHVGGHGSIRQCAEFLRTRMPHASAAMHEQNSVVAAQEVLDGDGTTAVIATEALAHHLGLEVLETEVDGGALGGWWALAARPSRPAGATHVALRVVGSAALTRSLATLSGSGLQVRTVTNQPTGDLFNYRYLVTARTVDARAVPDDVLDAVGDHLVGVFSTTTVR